MSESFKKTEAGLIPVDWTCRSIGEIAYVGRGRVISHREISRALSPTYPVYSSQTSNNGVMGYLDTYDFEGEYVTWTTDGVNAGTVFYRSGKFNCTNVCGTIELIDQSALYVALALSQRTNRHVSRNLANPKLMNDVMKQIKISLPSNVNEQHDIATAITEAVDLISSLDQLIAKKRDIQQATMQQLLTGQRRLSGFSGEWEVKRLGDIAELIMGQSPSSSSYNKRGIGLPLIQGNADIVDRILIKRVFTKEITKLGKCGDILLTVRAPVGEVARATFDVCLGRGVCAIRCGSDFLYHYLILIEPSWARLSKGSTFDSINSAELRSIELRLPLSQAEQTAIATILSDMDSEITALEARRDKTRQLKQGMMQELLTGRIRLV